MPDLVMVCGIAGVILLLILLCTYNSLSQMRQDVRRAWGRMDQQLKNRYALISDLVKMVQNSGAPAEEKLAAVTAARNQAAVAFNPTELAKAESDLSKGIQHALEAADQQESLKSDPRYIALRQNLLRGEKLIQESIDQYNEQVDALNTSMCSFPCIFAAKLIGLRQQPMFGP